MEFREYIEQRPPIFKTQSWVRQHFSVQLYRFLKSGHVGPVAFVLIHGQSLGEGVLLHILCKADHADTIIIRGGRSV